MSVTNDFPVITIIDGSASMQISKHGAVNPDGDPLWTSRFLETNPEIIIQAHLDFLEAGSDVISTFTYQASIEGFMQHLNKTETGSINLIKGAVDLARTAIEKFKETHPELKNVEIRIAGSVGPYGACLHDGSEYTGNYEQHVSKTFLATWHAKRIDALIDAGVDLLALETIPCLKEAETLVELIKNYPNIKAWLSFSCKDNVCLSNGENFQTAANFCYNLNPEQLVAVGVNCLSPKFVNDLIYGINKNRESIPIPLIVYPNSGEEYDEQYGWTGKNTCRPISEYVKTWLDMGVKWIGGCCRTDDTTIMKIRQELIKWKEDKQNQLNSSF